MAVPFAASQADEDAFDAVETTAVVAMSKIVAGKKKRGFQDLAIFCEGFPRTTRGEEEVVKDV